MSRLKLHALRKLDWVPDTENHWTLCQRHVDRSQIAAFEQGVTCRKCIAVLDFRKESEAWQKAYRERQKGT